LRLLPANAALRSLDGRDIRHYPIRALLFAFYQVMGQVF
jgi:hypothetical protein